MSFHGHYWTIAPHVAKALRPPATPPARHFVRVVNDPVAGAVRLTGRLSAPEESRDSGLVVVVHGLGGSAQSKYVQVAAKAAADAGYACLRLNLRGADRRGDDYFHAGLGADLGAALASPDLAGFDRVWVLGYSLGGHVTLRHALDGADRRVVAVAAVCAPLDLGAAVDAFDAGPWLYRRHVLGGMKEMYEGIASRPGRPSGIRALLPLAVAEARSIRTIREWDDRIVAPRWGFRDAADYYGSVGVSPSLGKISLPSLIAVAEHDPMVWTHTLAHLLDRVSPSVTVKRIPRGGHVGFPADLDLGEDAPRGLESQVVAWLTRQ